MSKTISFPTQSLIEVDSYSLFEPLEKTDESYIASVTKSDLYTHMHDACCEFRQRHDSDFHRKMYRRHSSKALQENLEPYLLKIGIALCRFKNVNDEDEQRMIDYFVRNYEGLEIRPKGPKYVICRLIQQEQRKFENMDVQKRIAELGKLTQIVLLEAKQMAERPKPANITNIIRFPQKIIPFPQINSQNQYLN